MTRSLQRLAVGLLIAFALVASALGYWGVMRRETLMAREDNPRLVLAEQRIRRGLILDRDEAIITATIEQDDVMRRHCVYPVAAPVVGYYSLRHGVGGIESAYDDVLRGDAYLDDQQRWMNQTLHRDQVGGNVRLTIDVGAQSAVMRALGDRAGAAVVISLPDGDVLALASAPTFDPNHLDEQWDALSDDPAAPLINRATQGLYQPGTGLQSMLLGAAFNSSVADSADPWEGGLSVAVDGATLPCGASLPRPVMTLGTAYQWACPAPFEVVGAALDSRRLELAMADFGLLDAPSFAIPTEAVTIEQPFDSLDAQLVAIGQSALTVSPLQMALATTALANDGVLVPLRLVEATQPPGGTWALVPVEGNPRAAIDRDSARAVAELMRRAVTQGAAQAAALPGEAVYGHAGLAVAGPGEATNAWFVGFVRGPDGQVVVVAVLIEDTGKAADAAEVGGAALEAGLAVTKDR